MTDVSPLVAIDSMTLVWGIRRVGKEAEKLRAAYLFAQLEQECAKIIVPAVVVSEFLCGVNPDDRDRVAATISERFSVPPFDIRCAKMAADLFMDQKIARKMNQPHARKCLRADALIVATAKAAGARIFYSDDKACRSMANKVMTARELPDQPPHLFGYDDPS